MALELIAPAKLNLTLEVLGKRDDGYHEIASVMQTISLADRIRIEPSSRIELVASGPEAGALPADVEDNLAYRAAIALRDAAGRPEFGARIDLDKQIPAGAGLGGGSSDAATVLRGLNHLWCLDFDIERLSVIAATLGSDLPFFLHGGTALATGRGEQIEPLPDVVPFDVSLVVPELLLEAKTARMYAAFDASDSEGGMPPVSAAGRSSTTATHSSRLASRVAKGALITAEDLYNEFDRVVVASHPEAARAFHLLHEANIPAIVCGSGPAVFTLASRETDVATLEAEVNHLRLIDCRSLSRGDALAVTEL